LWVVQKDQRMKNPVTTAVLFVLFMGYGEAWGQAFDTEFSPADEPQWTQPWQATEREEEPAEITSSDAVFYSPAWNAPDPFGQLARYRFGAVRYRQRGLEHSYQRVMVGDFDLSDNLSGSPDYTLTSLFWRTTPRREYVPALVAGSSWTGGVGTAEVYSPDISTASDGLFVAGRGGNRGSRGGVDVRTKIHGGTTHLSFDFTGRWGDDAIIKGVRSNNIGGMLALTREFRRGAKFTLLGAYNNATQGLRSAVTHEATGLTADRFYNPTWGYDPSTGRIRNSRERHNTRHLLVAVWQTPLDADRTLTATVGYRGGRSGYSALAWFNTHSPLPDYYRKMPSYFPDWSAQTLISEAWEEQNPAVTQLDWEELYYVNTLTDSPATYLLEERVEQARDLSGIVRIDRRLGEGFNLSYGVELRGESVRRFKEARDMLGGEWVYNIDQYVSDFDGEYRVGAGYDNDLRNAGRKVYQGDRFGYDYALERLGGRAFGVVRLDRTQWGITAGAHLRHSRLGRRGFYEKELFPGDESFGTSSQIPFTTYSLNAAAYFNPSVRHRLSVAVLASSEAPTADNIFVSPEQNNHQIPSPEPFGVYGAELAWSFAGKDVDVRLAGFAHSRAGETEVRSYYDDLSAVFSNMVVRGIDRLGYGVEAGVEARFTRWLSLRAGGSVGSYRYNSEPTATVLADIDNTVVSEGIVCYMSGLKTGAPEAVGAVELTYSDRHYLRVSLTGEWMGSRWVAINPLYHSSRVTGISSSPEVMRHFTEQERLPDAFTLGVSLSKGWVLGRGYLRVAGSVRNILNTPIIYSGYEQMRILRQGSGINRTLAPFPTKYLWSYPLTWNFTISYRL
jgi:hypothetical protein